MSKPCPSCASDDYPCILPEGHSEYYHESIYTKGAMTTPNAATLTDADIEELRVLATAVLADRLYVLGSEDKVWANRELVEQWNTTITPGLILQLTRNFAAGAASVRAVPEPYHGFHLTMNEGLRIFRFSAPLTDSRFDAVVMALHDAALSAAPTAQDQRAESVAATHRTDIGTQPTSAHPTPAPDAGEVERDDLVRRLYDMAKHDEKMVGYATLGWELYAQAAVRITADAVNLAALRLMVKDDAQWAQENERLTRERDELRERVKELERADKFALAAVSGVQRLRLKIAALEADLAACREDAERYRDIAFERGAMLEAPCFCCGYGGSGYFQPDTHPCAKKHHELYPAESMK